MQAKQAMYYRKEGDIIHCFLCPHHCRIRPGEIGICGVRKNTGKVLETLNYGRIAAYNLDPIEKKPLYHFHPGGLVLSAGSFGCNLKCSFCQNYSIAHGEPQTVSMTPEGLAEKAKEVEDNLGIAYTYNEPSIWYEYVIEASMAAKDRGLINVLVTNGFIGEQALDNLLPYIDAMNIDIKAFDDKYYRSICGGRLKPVLKTVEKSFHKCHVEVTTLVVGGLNDSLDEIRELGIWLSELSADIPVHLSRYYPAYRMNRPATPVDTLMKAKDVLEQWMNYVYIGNVPGVDNNTYCPSCGERIISRNGYDIRVEVKEGSCNRCGTPVNLII